MNRNVYVYETTGRHVLVRGQLGEYLRANGIPALRSPGQRGWLIRRERVARTRPVHLEPEGLKRAAAWIDHYRKHWEGAFDRIDALIARLQAEEDRNGRQ